MKSCDIHDEPNEKKKFRKNKICTTGRNRISKTTKKEIKNMVEEDTEPETQEKQNNIITKAIENNIITKAIENNIITKAIENNIITKVIDGLRPTRQSFFTIYHIDSQCPNPNEKGQQKRVHNQLHQKSTDLLS
jgi:hypothetical protein